MAVPPPFPLSARHDERARAKAALRPALRTARRAFASRATAVECAALARHLASAVSGHAIVGGYAAAGGEPDVIAALSGSGHALALPRPEPDGTMHFVAWDGAASLVRGAFGIDEPADGPAVVPSIVLVPLLGFDGAGNRLGQGGGHYDRWLAAYPYTVAIGVAWSVQRVSALPVEPWDVPLRLIVTEAGPIAP